MGPDCGTAYLNGVPLGFANAVPRGRVGLVAASGTGLQQVVALLAAGGEGVSQGIGVGGRDMSESVGAVMTLAALDALGGDPGTELVVVVGKPPGPAVRARVEARLRTLGKPAVVAMLGREVSPGREGALRTVTSLEDAAAAALAALSGREYRSPGLQRSRRRRPADRGSGNAPWPPGKPPCVDSSRAAPSPTRRSSSSSPCWARWAAT